MKYLPELLGGRASIRGFVVADARLRPLLANDEAIAILTYGGPPQSLADAFYKKVRPSVLRAHSSPTNPNRVRPIIKFNSGRRTYFCSVFPLNSNGNGSKDTAVLIVLERRMPRPLALPQVFQQFNLTDREREAVTLLLQGRCNKEIAEHMGISAYTVKSFLHTARIKMGASSRLGIMAKILGQFCRP